MIYVMLALITPGWSSVYPVSSLGLSCPLLRMDSDGASRAMASRQCAFLFFPCLSLCGHQTAYFLLCAQCSSILLVYFFSVWATGNTSCCLPQSFHVLPSGSAFSGRFGLDFGLIFGLSWLPGTTTHQLISSFLPQLQNQPFFPGSLLPLLGESY